MAFEIDFLPVGDGERGGDAIALRYGNLNGSRNEQVVIVVDGGTEDAGSNLVEHIKKYYKTDRIDLAILSHPDADYSSGLALILENMNVDLLCMHRPWEHAQDIKNAFQNGKLTIKGLRDNLKKSLEDAYQLESIARRKNIPISEPFSDFAKTEGWIVILGPSKEFYESLLPNFRETPKPKEAVTLITKMVTAVKEVINWIAEAWDKETLTDPQEGETSAENNTSVILLLQIDGKKFLFTADAGVEALNQAIRKAENLGVNLRDTGFVQIPHHGSKHNIGPSILNVAVGEKLQEKQTSKIAFVSAPKNGDPKHPSRKVVNAFMRRGTRVIATKESTKLFRSLDAPDRGWSDAEPLPFYDKVAE